jgi:hypothetical protein
MTTLLAVILVTTSFHLAAPDLMAQPGSWLRFLSSLSIWCTLADVLLQLLTKRLLDEAQMDADLHYCSCSCCFAPRHTHF